MKSKAAILFLSLVLVWKLIAVFFIQSSFYLRQAEITRLYCENKDRPEMKCNGKCYLSKQLKKIETEHKEGKKTQEKLSEYNDFFQNNSVIFRLQREIQNTVIVVFNYLNTEKETFIVSNSPPPEMI